MSENSKIIAFTLTMTTIVALVLGSLFFGLKPIHEKNRAVANKRAVLSTVAEYLPQPLAEMTDDQVLSVFAEKVDQVVVDVNGATQDSLQAENIDLEQERKKAEENRLYPIFIYNSDSGPFYVISIRGNGLWDAIWGNIALKSDLATIAGASFDHAGETPGLGAEIKDNPKFAEQFQEKRIYDYDGKFTSVIVRKGGAKDPTYEVDGLSGATVTANGVGEMLQRGIGYYRPYLEKKQAQLNTKSKAPAGSMGLNLN